MRSRLLQLTAENEDVDDKFKLINTRIAAIEEGA
jgi:hypothetical protein